MKKLFLPVFTFCIFLTLSGIWVFQSSPNADLSDNSIHEIILVVFLFLTYATSIIVGIKKFRNSDKGLPEEDELSARIIEKASFRSFYISFFIWSIILYLHLNTEIITGILFVYGFIGMAVVFIINWLVLNKTGVEN